jgi:hypothetical protein
MWVFDVVNRAQQPRAGADEVHREALEGSRSMPNHLADEAIALQGHFGELHPDAASDGRRDGGNEIGSG